MGFAISRHKGQFDARVALRKGQGCTMKKARAAILDATSGAIVTQNSDGGWHQVMHDTRRLCGIYASLRSLGIGRDIHQEDPKTYGPAKQLPSHARRRLLQYLFWRLERCTRHLLRGFELCVEELTVTLIALYPMWHIGV